MTRNQIEYWGYKEQQRSNLARERETNRANLAAEAENYRSHLAIEGLRGAELEETKRANLSNESREYLKYLENMRHSLISEDQGQQTIDLNTRAQQEKERSNRAQESISWSNLAEISRHNRSQESIQSYANVTQRMHNLNVEQETHRANVEQENDRKVSLLPNFRNANTNYRNTNLREDELGAEIQNNLENQRLRESELAERTINDLWRNVNQSLSSLQKAVNEGALTMVLGG